MSRAEHRPGDASPARPRLLIFNADDFGLTPATNAGVIGAHRLGPLRSASLMVTTPGFQDAVELARAHPALDLGIHLALTGMQPALPPERIPSLVAGQRFPSARVTLQRLLARRVRADELRAELEAQVERALATGLPFSHLDSHHHLHLFAPIAPIVGELAREYRIPFVRRIGGRRAERLTAFGASAKRLLLSWAETSSRSAYATLGRVDAFRGLPFPSTLDDWRRLLDHLPPGATEFMCHPGLRDATVAELDPLVEAREAELRWLCDPRLTTLLADAGVTTTSFAALMGQADDGAA